MKKYYLISDHYNSLDDYKYTKFARKNEIALVFGSYHYYYQLEFSQMERLQMIYRLIDICDGVFVAQDAKSEVARKQITYAKSLGKEIRFESKQWKLRKGEKND